MREIGISPRFSRDKFVPLQTKQRYSTRDISSEVFLTLFFRGFVPFLSLADFVSRDKNLQVADLQRLKSCFGELVTATTRTDLTNHLHGSAGFRTDTQIVTRQKMRSIIAQTKKREKDDDGSDKH